MYMQRTTSVAAGNDLYTTIKCMRGAAGIGLGTTTKHLRRTTSGAAGNGPATGPADAEGCTRLAAAATAADSAVARGARGKPNALPATGTARLRPEAKPVSGCWAADCACAACCAA